MGGVYSRFKEIALDSTHPFQDMIAAFLDSSNYNFIVGDETGDSQIVAMNTIIAANIDVSAALTVIKSIILSEANVDSQPFANATQAQFNSAKGLFTSKSISYISGKAIKVTLNTSFDERVAAHTWRLYSGSQPINAGKNVYMKEADSYIIEMTGKQSGDYEIRVPIVDADFTVELV